MSDLTWTVGEVSVATREGRYERTGLIRNGIGLDERQPKWGAPQWALTHLATGLQVCMLEGRMHDIIDLATEIADCADWAADGFAVSRELASRVRDIGDRSDGRFYRNVDQIDERIQ